MITQIMDNQEIKLAGLTVIVGLNNSGKTTIINEMLQVPVNGKYQCSLKLDGYDMDTNLELEYYKNQVILLDGVDRKCDPKNIIKLAENICSSITTGIKFVVTTFNPDFLKALNYYSKKYEIENVTNYYQTENIDDKIIISDKTKQLNKLYNLLTSDISEIFFKSVQQDLQRMKDLDTIKDTIKGNKQEKLADYVGVENIKTRSWQLGINDSNASYPCTMIQNLAGENVDVPIKSLFYGPQNYGKLFYDCEQKIFWMIEVNEDECDGKRNELKEEFGEKFTDDMRFFII